VSEQAKLGDDSTKLTTYFSMIALLQCGKSTKLIGSFLEGLGQLATCGKTSVKYLSGFLCLALTKLSEIRHGFICISANLSV
jgi:hypothetical protein